MDSNRTNEEQEDNTQLSQQDIRLLNSRSKAAISDPSTALPSRPLAFNVLTPGFEFQFRAASKTDGSTVTSLDNGFMSADNKSFSVNVNTTGKSAATSWMPAVEEPAFSCPRLQPFYEEDSVTKFYCKQSAEEIFASLLRAVDENDCIARVDREKGTINVSCFVDFSRVEATFRVYRTGNRHLVNYSRCYGDRIPATRLFFTLANASKLVVREIPRLLRRRSSCSETTRHGKEEKATTAVDSPPPGVVSVYVDMLSSVFAEEVLVGAQGIARECYSRASSKPYAAHLPAIVHAFTRHQSSGIQGHLVCRDIVVCLANVIEKVSAAAEEAALLPACDSVLRPLLECAATMECDAESARACLKAVITLCESSVSLKHAVESELKSVVTAAISGKGPCSLSGESPAFLQAPAHDLKAILAL